MVLQETLNRSQTRMENLPTAGGSAHAAKTNQGLGFQAGGIARSDEFFDNEHERFRQEIGVDQEAPYFLPQPNDSLPYGRAADCAPFEPEGFDFAGQDLASFPWSWDDLLAELIVPGV
jgi:hypothetical protein